MKKYLQKLLFGIKDLPEIKSESSHIKKTTYNIWNEEDSNLRNKQIFNSSLKEKLDYYTKLLEL